MEKMPETLAEVNEFHVLLANEGLLPFNTP